MDISLRRADLGKDGDALVALIGDYLTWGIDRLRREYGLDDSPTDPSTIRESLATYELPTGLLIVAEQGGEPIGLAGLRTLTPGIVEVKRMYVDPRGRGLGIGSALLDRLLADAREVFAAKVVRLDTARFMADAQTLYASRGFIEREPYEETEIPPQMRHHWRFFERTI
ncbi:GNAT family N-acetyltransferase [Actinoplanes sp. M2I2]|uniref:GNAT family N-acetyltransferase n=1 Tax=Actinoplanes sp. M2I2 TaxID=1734444 RepID=UPI002020E6FA|nr:GNAT family N-acetyltransferase [Actinoplanes sp. M2I2]